MFPYSFGVQAATKAKALSDLDAQIAELAKKHPEEADTHGGHLDAVHAAAAALVDMLPDDDEGSDVAISAAGHLTKKKNADGNPEVQAAEFTAFAQRTASDPSKYSKEPKKEPKGKDAAAKSQAGDKHPLAADKK
jgi:hypothetical protein